MREIVSAIAAACKGQQQSISCLQVVPSVPTAAPLVSQLK